MPNTELEAVFAKILDKFSNPDENMLKVTTTAGGSLSPVSIYVSWLKDKGLRDPMS